MIDPYAAWPRKNIEGKNLMDSMQLEISHLDDVKTAELSTRSRRPSKGFKLREDLCEIPRNDMCSRDRQNGTHLLRKRPHVGTRFGWHVMPNSLSTCCPVWWWLLHGLSAVTHLPILSHALHHRTLNVTICKCAMIASELNYTHLSAGDLLRLELQKKGSELAAKIDECIT